MQKWTFKISMLVLVLFMTNCTTNNGPHSDIYGMWKVDDIYINGEREQDFDNYLFLQFQSDVVRVVGGTSCFGRWEQHDDYSEIVMWFNIEGQYPPTGSHFVVTGANVCKVERLTSKKFVFTMTNPQSTDSYTYYLRKW